MAYSTERATSDGTLKLFTLSIDFFDKTDISVFVGEDLQVVDVDYKWNTSTTIEFTTAVPAGVEILIRRATSLAEPRHIFSQGSPFIYETLDEDFRQILFIAQESIEGLTLGDLYNDLDMHGNKVVGIGTPTAPGDAASKGYTDKLIADILSTGQGPINNAANVVYTGANGYFGSVQDLAFIDNPLKGASMVGLFGGGNLGQINHIVTPAMKGAVPGTDATAAIQAAMDDARPIVVIESDYLVNVETRIRVPSWKRIIAVGNSKLTALAATSAFYSFFDLENVTDIDFVNLRLVGDRDIHLGSGGEQGFGIRALSVKRVRVLGGEFSKMWGDGVYFGASNPVTHTNCEDITIVGVNSHHNRRQGLSMTGVKGARIMYSKFNDTNGTNPQSGVDFEPNAGFECTGIVLFACEANDNAGAGFELLDASGNGKVDGVTFEACVAKRNGSNGLRLVSARNVKYTGEISNNVSHGVYAIQGSTGLRLPSPNIHHNGGDGVQLLTNSTGALIGKGVISNNAGFGVQANYKATLDQVELHTNALGGFYFGSTSADSSAYNCDVHDNGGTGGESAASSVRTLVSGGRYVGNATGGAGHNLAIYGNDCHVVGGVRVRVGSNPNKPAYGLRTTGNSGLVCKGNDFRGSGATGDIFQATLTGADVSDNFPYQRVGTTAQRPTLYLSVGMEYYDTTIGKPIYYFGGGTPWRDAANVAA